MLNKTWGYTSAIVLAAAMAGQPIYSNLAGAKAQGPMGGIPSAVETGMAAHIVGVHMGLHERMGASTVLHLSPRIEEMTALMMTREEAIFDEQVVPTLVDDEMQNILRTAYADGFTGAYSIEDLERQIESFDTVQIKLSDARTSIAETLIASATTPEQIEITISGIFQAGQVAALVEPSPDASERVLPILKEFEVSVLSEEVKPFVVDSLSIESAVRSVAVTMGEIEQETWMDAIDIDRLSACVMPLDDDSLPVQRCASMAYVEWRASNPVLDTSSSPSP